MAIAFFDLDRTLISKNSGALWIKKEIREGRMMKRDILRAAYGLTRYTLGFAGIEGMVLLAISRLEGIEEVEMRRRVDEFYDQEVHTLYRSRAATAVEEHRRRGDRVMLLTSASSYLSERVEQTLELDGILCNRFEVRGDGRFSGRPDGPLCFGTGKLIHAQKAVERAGCALADCYFYTDSFADISVMEVVGHPVAVHPDPRLERTAKKLGWPIRDWGP